MPQLGNLVVKILGDTKDIKRKLDGYEKKVDDAKKSTDKFAKGVKSSFKTFIKYAAILGGAFLAVKKLTDFIKSSLDAYGKQEKAITELNSALEATGKFTPQLSKELQQLASDLQDTTTYGDEVTLSAMAMLQSLADLSGKGLKEAIPLVQDLAAGMNIDLNTAASLVGKTLGSSTNALSRYGIVLDMSGSKAEKLAELQEQVNEKFGGRAAAIAETYSGKVESLQNAYGDLKETMGSLMADRIEPMLPVITRMIKKLGTWITKKQELKDAYENLKKPMEDISDLTRLQILEDEQLIAIDKLNKLEKQRATIQTDAYAQAISRETGNTQEQIDALRKEIRARAQLIENMQRAIRLRDEEAQKIKEGTEAEEEDGESKEKVIEATRTTAEEMEYLGQTLGIVNNIMAGEFAPNLGIFTHKLNGLQVAAHNVNLELDDTAENVKDFLQNYMAGIVQAQNVTNNYARTLDEFRNAYNEWAQDAEEKVAQVTNVTSLGVNAIDSVYSQMFQNRRIELDNWYEAEKDRIYATIEDEEERESALEALEHEADQRRRQIARDEAKANKNIAIINAIMHTAQAVTKAWAQGGFLFGGLMAAFVAAMGAAQIALIRKQPLPALAEGGELITNGPQLIMVGDNPGGRELVQATPLSSPNVNGPSREITLNNNVYLDSDQILGFISKATEDGRLLIHKNAVRDW